MFTKRHYEALARLVGEVNWQDSIDGFGKTTTARDHLIKDLVWLFEADNEKFNKDIFVSTIDKVKVAWEASEQELENYSCQYCGDIH